MSGGVPVPVEAEIARIETTIRDDGAAYWRDPDMRRRYGELLEARAERGGTTPPRRPGAADAEIAAIEKRMRDDFAGYRADPDMQARYGALLEARGGAGRSGADIPATSPDRKGARAAMAETLGSVDMAVAGLRAAGRRDTLAALSDDGAGDFASNLRAVQMVAVDVARDLNDPAAAESFLDAFTRLPDRVQAAACQALLSDGGRHPAASAAELATYRAEDDAAATLLAEWGGNAAARLGVARARLAAIAAGLDDDERARLDHFVTTAPVGEWTAILRHLADPSPAQARPGYRSLWHEAA